ncbi:MAG TPA: type II secretion system protein [Phycisphaerales bacterium]|nr:type II secretion system protein [Phycisphaerales bacterium]
MSKVNRIRSAPGFSLIELLVVIGIIALVVAIIVPALGGARIAAKKTATSQLLTQITDASLQFSQDSGKMPGYFSPSEMGQSTNERQGFTGMENLLLDLIGGDAVVGRSGNAGSGDGVDVGPLSGGLSYNGKASNVKVDLNLLGKGDRVYLQNAQDYLQPTDGQEGTQAHRDFPDIVDAFGSPVLAWMEDPRGPREPTSLEEFATEDSDDDPAKFYWMSNAGWLQSDALGKIGRNQQTDSLLYDPGLAPETLSAVLGSPNFPIPNDLPDGTPLEDVRPGASRGALVIHSAGADGVYFATKDAGARAIGVDDPRNFLYGLNFFTSPPTQKRRTDSNGKITSIDVTSGFDDMISTAGN